MANRVVFTPHYAGGFTPRSKVASCRAPSNPFSAFNMQPTEWQWSWYLDGSSGPLCRLGPHSICTPSPQERPSAPGAATHSSGHPSSPLPPGAAGRPAFCRVLAESARQHLEGRDAVDAKARKSLHRTRPTGYPHLAPPKAAQRPQPAQAGAALHIGVVNFHHMAALHRLAQGLQVAWVRASSPRGARTAPGFRLPAPGCGEAPTGSCPGRLPPRAPGPGAQPGLRQAGSGHLGVGPTLAEHERGQLEPLLPGGSPRLLRFRWARPGAAGRPRRGRWCAARLPAARARKAAVDRRRPRMSCTIWNRRSARRMF